MGHELEPDASQSSSSSTGQSSLPALGSSPPGLGFSGQWQLQQIRCERRAYLPPARSGRKSRLLLVHNGHTIEHKRDVSTEEKFMADKFARFNLDWKALRNLKAGHQWCEYLSFGLDNGKLLNKVKSLLED